MPSSLPIQQGAPTSLQRETIMDPQFAREYGAKYVRLAAFAIDVDRVREVLEDGAMEDPAFDDVFPLGWEVFVTQQYLLSSACEDDDMTMLEEMCASVRDMSRRGDLLGAQLLFAVRDLRARGKLAPETTTGVKSWGRVNHTLRKSLDMLWADIPLALGSFSEACLSLEIDPPLSPTTVKALEALLPLSEGVVSEEMVSKKMAADAGDPSDLGDSGGDSPR